MRSESNAVGYQLEPHRPSSVRIANRLPDKLRRPQPARMLESRGTSRQEHRDRCDNGYAILTGLREGFHEGQRNKTLFSQHEVGRGIKFALPFDLYTRTHITLPPGYTCVP